MSKPRNFDHFSLQPRDVLSISHTCPKTAYQHDRAWMVTGVYLGALQQESVIGITPMDMIRPDAPVPGRTERISEMLVPEILLRILWERGDLSNDTTGQVAGSEVAE